MALAARPARTFSGGSLCSEVSRWFLKGLERLTHMLGRLASGKFPSLGSPLLGGGGSLEGTLVMDGLDGDRQGLRGKQFGGEFAPRFGAVCSVPAVHRLASEPIPSFSSTPPHPSFQRRVCFAVCDVCWCQLDRCES